MAKIILLTAAAIGAGAESLAALIAANPADAAADIILINDAQAELESVNKELTLALENVPAAEAVAEIKKPVLSEETFTLDKQKYGFAYPALNFEGRIINNDDVLADKKLQAALVEMKSGFIVKK